MSIVVSLSQSSVMATKVASGLDCNYFEIQTRTFSDGEFCFYGIPDIKDEIIFFIASIQIPHANLMDNLLLLSEIKSRSPKKIVLIIPYLVFSRQDKRNSIDESLLSVAAIELLAKTGIDEVLLIDTHNKNTNIFFEKVGVKTHNLFFQDKLIRKIFGEDLKSLVLVAPDSGGVKLVQKISERLNVEYVVVEKERLLSGEIKRNLSEDTSASLKNKVAIIVDDIIDTAGTMVSLVELLQKIDLKGVSILATHAVLSGTAGERLAACSVTKVITTDSITIKPQTQEILSKKLEVLPLADILVDFILENRLC